MIGCAPIPFVGCWPEGGHHLGGPFGVLTAVGAFALWIWVLVDVLTKETEEDNQRLIWGLVVGFTYVIGALIYIIVRRPERFRKLGR